LTLLKKIRRSLVIEGNGLLNLQKRCLWKSLCCTLSTSTFFL